MPEKPNLSYHGQAGQDQFVTEMTRFKTNGFFLEIGGFDPIDGSNGYVLETPLNWKGILVEMNQQWLPRYKLIRPKTRPIMCDATQIGYLKELEQDHFPPTVDYLQIDLDADNRSTLTTVEKIERELMPTYTFGVVTFEHDFYRGDFYDTRHVSRMIFARRGYIRLFSDVALTGMPFEDWYAHPYIIDRQLCDKITSDPENHVRIEWTQCLQIVRKYV